VNIFFTEVVKIPRFYVKDTRYKKANIPGEMYILPGASKIEFRRYRWIDIIHLTLNNCGIKSPIANLNDEIWKPVLKELE